MNRRSFLALVLASPLVRLLPTATSAPTVVVPLTEAEFYERYFRPAVEHLMDQHDAILLSYLA